MQETTMEKKAVAASRYDAIDLLYGFLCVFFGFFFLKGITAGGPGDMGFGMTILTVVFVSAVFIYRAVTQKDSAGRKINWGEAILLPVLILLLGGTFGFTTGVGMKITSLVLIVVLILYWIFILFGNREAGRLDGSSFADSLTAFLIMPFGNYVTLFGALFRKREKKHAGAFGSVLIGLAAAIIPTLVVILLLSGDLLFKDLTKQIGDFLKEYFIIDLITFVASIPVSMYLFAVLYANRKGKLAGVISQESKHRAAEAVRIVNPVIACSAMTPVILLYIVYLGLHIGYYFSAFRQHLPEGFTVSGYARSGFFELLVVALINLSFIAVGSIFIRHDENGKRPLSWAIFASIFSLLTIGLMISAASKMVLYIRIFGMTYLRVSTMWFMIFIGIAFIYILIRQFALRFNVVGATIVTGILMFLVFIYSSPDAWIAKYNIDTWKAGKLDTVDVEALDKLSDGATPYLIILAEDPDPKVSQAASAALSRRAALEKKTLLESNVGYLYAQNKLEAYAKKVAGTDKDISDLIFTITNDSSDPIKSISMDFTSYKLFGSVESSMGCENANGSPYEKGDVVYVSFPIPEGSDRNDFSIGVTVYTMDGSSYYAGSISSWDFKSSCSDFSITGGGFSGFDLIRKEKE
ncbi:MAG: DUF4173 domain-containing protein [Clostridia bacterium]|nr:DUF4173 domain-containing protein [Clostridia bacterium]